MAITQSGRTGSSGNYDKHKDEAARFHFLDLSAQDGLTATAGGAQAGFDLSNYHGSRFTTVATAADSAQLPAAKPGRMRVVKNAAAANSMNVFPQTGEAINAGAANAAFAIAANKMAIFFCFVAGTWDVVLSA